jgi:lipopolysaccharide transport system permease protein
METIIENKRGINLSQRLKELSDFRELLITLAYRDFRVKYAQTILGLLWAIIEPLFSAIILSLIFNKIAGVNTFGINPILFGLSGMMVWNYFANVIHQGSNSLILAQNMVKKIYFPRIIVPASKAIASLPDLLITIVFTLIFYFIVFDGITLNLLFLPIFIVLTIIVSLSLAVWFSALNIRYRDFQHIVPFMTRIGLFLTPVAYSSFDIPENYRWIFYLNPLTGVIEAIRWSMFNISVNWNLFSISLFVALFFLFSGFLYFNKLEKSIADII